MNKVLMIGLDGATFSLLDPLMDEGIMPFLGDSIANGVRSELTSTRNPLTPPAWVSMVTGRKPAAHGIHDFVRPEFSNRGNLFLRVNDSRDIRVETLWSMVSRQGRRVTSLNFYGMSPPIPVEGYMIGGFVPWRHLRQAAYPRSLFDIAKGLEDFDYKLLGMDIGEEKKCVQGLLDSEHEDWIQLQSERDAAWARLLAHLMRTDPTDLTAVVLDGPDKMQHIFWRFLDPDLVDANAGDRYTKIRDMCLSFYRALDATLARLCTLAGPETTVILTSDHGFGPTTEIVFLNEWLAQHGYLEWTPDGNSVAGGHLTADRMRDHLGTVNWQNTLAFCPTPSSNSIYVKRDTGSGRGVKTEEYLDFCAKLKHELEEFRDADGRSVFTEVHLNRLEGTPFTDETPDLTVRLRDGGFVSILKGPDRAVVVPRPHIDGTHRPNGIFLAWGPALKRGKVLSTPLSLLDVTPLILHLLGLHVPKGLDGRVPQEIFRSEAVRAVASAGQTRTVQREASPQEATEEEKEVLMRQMKLLGYME